ncbi:SAM-dependent DNA methyltransferase [Mycobacterium frederiksbergense]|uniref:type I restriction-modification system subunit M n=1 Tax=Mycolicibacterium frederiksbergense TaxID=117567 RepID=UPI0021F2DF56|nr:class I SAM-dependent DNA methyltransferase [Mycolicibacterium frederiksbergense]MCV7044177.1 SAM-dependent DNA methyltransferase [Mycolicibacterium frederiksbergense]
MSNHAELRRLVDKLWSYCDVLRDAGVSNIDYVEQLSYLLFLKMADERQKGLRREQILPAELEISWDRLTGLNGLDLEVEYRRILDELSKQATNLGVIFRKAQNKIQEPALLRKLIVDLIGSENWSVGGDLNGDAYEGLLQKSASDVKSGAGQYFTPRVLIHAVVDVMRPTPADTITDPACGTAGFLLAAVDYLNKHYSDSMTPDQRRALTEGRTVHGVELVDATARLGTMNMYLHGIGQATGEPVIGVRDALSNKLDPVSMVLANPPFGRKSSITVIGDDGRAERDDIAYSRSDFWVTTTNKQLNFVQHIATALKIDGRAAVVVPDNVLFEGGAGETVRRRLLNEYDVHTLLRLPTGIFYAGGVKANVLFFDRKQARPSKPWTEKLWVYDLRTGSHFTLKQRPMLSEHLLPFTEAYNAESRLVRTESERFRAFEYDDLMARDKLNLDITWLKDPSAADLDDGVPPEIIAQEIVDDLTAALAEFSAVADALAARAASSDDSD